MRFQGALLREQGVEFAIVIVRRNILDDRMRAAATINSFQSIFPRRPVVLMGQDLSGRATYYGRPDIVRFMASVPLEAVPWKEFSLN
jgi:hypothetical protein